MAAGYERIVQTFLRWARSRADIRAAVVVGSRARKDHPADEWADMDLVLFVDDPSRYTQDAGWVSELGEPWITFVEPTAVGESLERRVLFDGGLDVDVALFPAALLERMAAEEMPAAFADPLRRGNRILIDHAGTLAAAVSRIPPAAPPPVPTEHEVLEVVNDFWYHAVWTAKHLRRGELWWAKGACDHYMKDLLRQMMEWHTRSVAAPGRDTWMRGRFLEEWADPRARIALRRTFAHYNEDDVWKALVATMDLFRWLSVATAHKLGFEYPAEADHHASNLVRTLSRERSPSRRRAAPRKDH